VRAHFPKRNRPIETCRDRTPGEPTALPSRTPLAVHGAPIPDNPLAPPGGPPSEVIGFIREMISQIDPKHESERLEAVAFALADFSDAMHDLISGNGEPRH
jgi:hypothetical protein